MGPNLGNDVNRRNDKRQRGTNFNVQSVHLRKAQNSDETGKGVHEIVQRHHQARSGTKHAPIRDRSEEDFQQFRDALVLLDLRNDRFFPLGNSAKLGNWGSNSQEIYQLFPGVDDYFQKYKKLYRESQGDFELDKPIQNEHFSAVIGTQSNFLIQRFSIWVDRDSRNQRKFGANGGEENQLSRGVHDCSQ